jgi:GNAT superfamily N-acetyltransferase
MPDQTGGILLSDGTLARRIEAADAAVGVTSAEVHARVNPGNEAVVEQIAGGVAVFVGIDSPLTQALGTGMRGPVSTAEMDRLERFFTTRGADVHIEVCPHADPMLLEELSARGYRLREFSNMLVRRIRTIETPPAGASSISVQLSTPADAELWARTVALGFGGELAQSGENVAVLRDLFQQPNSKGVLAWVEGRPAGGGALTAHEGVAAIFGASTVPSFRRLGVQSAVIRALISYALEAGCDIAYTLTRPGSASQRNVERQGFRIAYTRCTMVRSA